VPFPGLTIYPGPQLFPSDQALPGGGDQPGTPPDAPDLVIPAFRNYQELRDAIANWLNRSDLSDYIPLFIALAEAKIRRKLRRTTFRSTIYLVGDTVALPADVAELRSIGVLPTLSTNGYQPVDILTPAEYVEKRAKLWHDRSRPRYACIFGGEIHFTPIPRDPCAIEIVYFTVLPPLSESAPTNRVLTEAPDLYLYGALLEAEPFLEHDERAPLWERRFEAAIAELNSAREQEEYNASLRPVRLPVVFG